MWDVYHVFLIAMLVFTRLLLDEIYHLIELPFEWLIVDAMFVCLLDELILSFCCSDLTLEFGGFELTSTITLVLQANRLTKCASHPNRLTKCSSHIKYKTCKIIWLYMVSLPPPITTGERGRGEGDLIWNFANTLRWQKFFLHVWQDKPLWVELKTNRGAILLPYYYAFIISFL